jgi:peptide/nickel transport system permease protein
MTRYLIRRLLYVVPTILGVMLLTFVLFFVFTTPEAIARRILGEKVSMQARQQWLHARGYDKPTLLNVPGVQRYQADRPWWDAQFVRQMTDLAKFELGRSDITGERIWDDFKKGAIPSLLLTVPAFFCGLIISVSLALLVVYLRRTQFDRATTLVCVAFMSMPVMVVVIFGQWLGAIELALFPVFGYTPGGLAPLRFLALPVTLSVLAGLGGSVRLYRTIFLEEARYDYVRTAEAKGASPRRVLFVHILKNGAISLITLVVTALPFLVAGSLVMERFFGIPGLGFMLVNAIQSSDFAVVRASVFVGALLYIGALMLTDICYALVDPRIRLE